MLTDAQAPALGHTAFGRKVTLSLVTHSRILFGILGSNSEYRSTCMARRLSLAFLCTAAMSPTARPICLNKVKYIFMNKKY